MKRVFGTLVVAVALPLIITALLVFVCGSICINGLAETDRRTKKLVEAMNNFSK